MLTVDQEADMDGGRRRYDYDINVGRCSAVAIKEKVRYGLRKIAIAAVQMCWT